MIILDRMLIGGIKFVLGKVASAVDTELNDDSHLREELLASQMRLELGEISEEEFQHTERSILERLREIRVRQRGEDGAPPGSNFEVVGIDAPEELHGAQAPGRAAGRRASKRARR